MFQLPSYPYIENLRIKLFENKTFKELFSRIFFTNEYCIESEINQE